MIDPDKKSLVISEYINGKNISQLSKEHSVSCRTISIWLKKENLLIRQTNGRELNLDKVEIQNLYDQGLTTYKIAEMKKCSDETIRKLIDNIKPIEIRNIRDNAAKEKISSSCRMKWQDEKYKQKVRDSTSKAEYKLKLSESAKAHKTLFKWVKSKEGKERISTDVKARWLDASYRSKQEQYYSARILNLQVSCKEALKDPSKRAQWLDKLRIAGNNHRNSPGYISLPQRRLYEYLRISGVVYHEEGLGTKVGPYYTVDCIVRKQHEMQRDLIIKIQGEYWHSLKHAAIKDQQKLTYVRKHTDYDMIHISDLNTKSYEEVRSKLLPYGIRFNNINCKVKDLQLKRIDNEVAKDFISKHHYLETIRNGSYHFGAYHGEMLVWVISYAFPIRLEVAKKQGLENNQVLEISRIVRMPNLICKNLASYMIAKTRSLLPDYIKLIISYADSTEGHTGGVYKAAGFTFNGDVAPDYCYISDYGRYHKKTIWDKAKKFKMSESEYAIKHGLKKVKTDSKSRWIFTM